MSLARNLAQNLVAVGGSVSMRELSDRSGVSERTIVSVRQGPIAGTLPHMRTVERLASGLEISTALLCAGQEELIFWGKLSLRKEFYDKDSIFESEQPDYKLSRMLYKREKLFKENNIYAHAFLIMAFASCSCELAESFATHRLKYDQNKELFI